MDCPAPRGLRPPVHPSISLRANGRRPSGCCLRENDACGGPFDRLRANGSRIARTTGEGDAKGEETPRATPLWIPAFAGMTMWGSAGRRVLVVAGGEVPACAGTTERGEGTARVIGGWIAPPRGACGPLFTLRFPSGRTASPAPPRGACGPPFTLRFPSGRTASPAPPRGACGPPFTLRFPSGRTASPAPHGTFALGSCLCGQDGSGGGVEASSWRRRWLPWCRGGRFRGRRLL